MEDGPSIHHHRECSTDNADDWQWTKHWTLANKLVLNCSSELAEFPCGALSGAAEWNNMDWQGQTQSEHLMQYTLLASALIAFLTGYIMSSYLMMLTIYLIGAGITMLVTVTDWAYFNRHPLEWWEPRYDDIPSTRELRLQQKQRPHQPFKLVHPYARS